MYIINVKLLHLMLHYYVCLQPSFFCTMADVRSVFSHAYDVTLSDPFRKKSIQKIAKNVQRDQQ